MGSSLHILLVEDHVDTQELMSRLLRLSRHEVMAAGSVHDALELAGANSFDLVISDIGLPDGDGLQLMQELKKKYGLKGIALTGYGSDEELAAAREAGFAAQLVKPIEFGKLEEAIGQVVGR